MSKRQVMVIATALIMVAGGSIASSPKEIAGLGVIIFMGGLVLFIAFVCAMYSEKS